MLLFISRLLQFRVEKLSCFTVVASKCKQAVMASTSASDIKQRTCGYIVAKKSRPCRALVKAGKKYCWDHSLQEENGTSSEKSLRMPCPYDPKHSCFVWQLEKHLAKCNARPKPLPEYIQKDINVMDPLEEEIKISLGSLTDQELLDIIHKVDKIHGEYLGKLKDSFGRHEVLEPTLNSLTESRGSWRHVYQNASILYNMAQAGILVSDEPTTYVEFGSGRGHLSYVLGQAVDLATNSLVMIDKSSPRHKHENRFKTAGQSHPSIHRIRSDIADIELGRVPHVQQNARRLVGTGKHLCGAATDLALHCLARAHQLTGLVQGACIALCCHHQCTWRHYVGKAFFKQVDLSARDFAVMRALTSWATCGASAFQTQQKTAKGGEDADEEHEAPEKEDSAAPGRYSSLNLDAVRRELIGRQCKQIIDQGRVAYLSAWLQARLVHYVEQDVSLENVLLLASSR